MFHVFHFLLGNLNAHFFSLVSFPNFFCVIANNDTKSKEKNQIKENDRLVDATLSLKILPSLFKP